MCKHVAAVLYGVGARLDKKPELLFVLRKVDHQALIPADLDMQAATAGRGKRRRLANQDLSSMFGIDIEDTPLQKTSKNTAAGRGKSRVGKSKTTSGKRTFTPTGAAVARLRKQFTMTRSQFADLLGVSPQTVAHWETKRGRLKLQERTLTALTRVWLRK